jgi:hypothetical protein
MRLEIYESPDAWREEAKRIFGDDPMNWRFVCPSCGHVASVADWKAAGASEGEVAFSCVGRHLKGSKQMCEKPGPCNYAGGGLIGLNPVAITVEPGKVTRVFAFASKEGAK